MRLRTIWQLDAMPRRLPADFVAELRRRIREGTYDSAAVATEVARELLHHGNN